MTEAAIQSASVKWLRREMGCYCIKLSTYRGLGSAGWPDYLVLGDNGLHFFIEFKKPGGKVTELQKMRHEGLVELGHSVHICHSLVETKAAYHDEVVRLELLL